MPRTARKQYQPNTKKHRRRASGTKTAFIESLPGEMSARDVVDRAKAAGMILTTDRVHRIRWSIRQRAAVAAPTAAIAQIASTAKPMPPVTASTTTSTTTATAAAPQSKLAQLRRLILELGTNSARGVWREVERAESDINYRFGAA